MPLTNYLATGIFWKSCLSDRWSKDLPHTCNTWHWCFILLSRISPFSCDSTLSSVRLLIPPFLTGLYELWKTGSYKNYAPDVLVDLVARILALVPPWTRVYRIQRDIPMPLVTSGVENGNLRELSLRRMADFGTKCRDVRTREVGIKDIHQRIRPDQVITIWHEQDLPKMFAVYVLALPHCFGLFYR